MFGKMPTVTQPKEPEQIKIPSPDDPELLAARKKKMQDEFASRQGRDSTKLAGTAVPGTSPAYSRTTLG